MCITCAVSMITKLYNYRGRHKPACESYEDKYERRQEKHENLRRRNNITICRLMTERWSKEPKEVLQSPRQKEFFRRRNLIIEEQGKKRVKPLCQNVTSLVLKNKIEDFAEISSVHFLRSSLTKKVFWNNSTSQLAPSNSAQHSFNDGFAHDTFSSWGIFPENMAPVKFSKSCKGTQTMNESNAVKKNSGQQTDCGIAVLDKEIVQLSNYLREALHRELLLKNKLTILQELLAMLLQAAETSWKDQINEDQLKSRVNVLEKQLQASIQSYSKWSLKKTVLEMEDQKQNYEQKAKESLQKLLEEKVQAERQLQNAQRALAVAEEDSSLWKEHYNTLEKEWLQLTDKHHELENKFHVLENKLQWSDDQNVQLHQALQNLENQRVTLCSKINALEEDSKLRAEYVIAIEGRLKIEERQKVALEEKMKCLHNVVSMNSQVLSPATDRQSVSSEDHNGAKKNHLQEQLQESTSQFMIKEEERQHDHWIPLLMVVLAAAVTAYLANFIP